MSAHSVLSVLMPVAVSGAAGDASAEGAAPDGLFAALVAEASPASAPTPDALSPEAPALTADAAPAAEPVETVYPAALALWPVAPLPTPPAELDGADVPSDLSLAASPAQPAPEAPASAQPQTAAQPDAPQPPAPASDKAAHPARPDAITSTAPVPVETAPSPAPRALEAAAAIPAAPPARVPEERAAGAALAAAAASSALARPRPAADLDEAAAPAAVAEEEEPAAHAAPAAPRAAPATQRAALSSALPHAPLKLEAPLAQEPRSDSETDAREAAARPAAASPFQANASATASASAPTAAPQTGVAPNTPDAPPASAGEVPPAAPETPQSASTAPRDLGLSLLSRATVETTAQIAARILKTLDGRSTRFDMALTPEELGRVDVSLEIGDDGRLTARLAFDNPAAAVDLRARADELRRQLQDAGFHLAEDSLQFAERDPSSNFGGGFERQPDRRAFAGAARLADEADAAVPPPGAWASLSLTPDRVDLKV